jgi:xanthine dehydrogenase accessory factor
MNDLPATTRAGLRGLLECLDTLHARAASGLLGIVVATEGSTYQKPGALIALDAAARLVHGVISGGCLEPELERRARDVVTAGSAAVVDFDTRSDEDLVFGSGTGCRGRVHLLLLPQPPQAPLAAALRSALDAGVALDIELAVAGASAGAGSARLAPAGTATVTTMGQLSVTADPDSWHWDARGFASPGPGATDVHLRIAPPPRIALLGAGPESPPLLAAMRRLGWSTTLVEHRQRWAAFAHVEPVDDEIASPPVVAAAALAQRRFDAAIVMSHNYTLDAQQLRFCAAQPIGYVGLLGPPARRDALLAELGDVADALRPRLRAPVGLDLGGSGPEAIALAIVAELQQYFARRARG